MASIRQHAINWKNDKAKGIQWNPIYGYPMDTLYSIPYRNTAYTPATLWLRGGTQQAKTIYLARFTGRRLGIKTKQARITTS